MASAKINLLIEVASFDTGGLEKVVLDSAQRFDRDKIEVAVLSVGKIGRLARIAREHGIRVFRLPLLNRGRYYRRLLQRLNINFTNSHFSFVGYPIFHELNIPNITYIHGVYAFLRGQLLDTFKDVDRFVDRYISVSRNATHYATARFGLRPEKIVTIPNGLIIDQHEEHVPHPGRVSREELGLAGSDYVFLNVASYNLHKGHYLMADAMRRLRQTRDDIKIICIGDTVNRSHLNGFRKHLAALGLEHHILMPGYQADVEAFHAISDAFLLPSFSEGWSLAMNEAMFYGKPMILTATGGAPEVIENNDIGILVENEYGDVLNLDARSLDDMAYNQRQFRTAGVLARAMVEFADHREYWRRAGLKGRDKVKERYDFADVVRRYENVFAEVLRERSTTRMCRPTPRGGPG
jgi:glycosyltransferase involved in cell wall biosynthesis